MGLSACGAFSSSADPAPTPPEDPPAVAVADAGAVTRPEPDASPSPEAGPAPPPPLLEDPGFEGQGASCGPAWPPHKASTERVSPGNTGAKACRVCGPTLRDAFSIEASVPAKPGRWSFEAALRDARIGTLVNVFVHFRAKAADGVVLAARDPKPLLGSGWTGVSDVLDVPTTAATVTLQFEGDGSNIACFDLDDVVLTAPP